ncbi:hypothetical protein HK104_005945 [Borealophlyctis nickersoniae]|nr:hypothetical protein HK104_005945 [Borealophlyctis nickersoniae]
MASGQDNTLVDVRGGPVFTQGDDKPARNSGDPRSLKTQTRGRKRSITPEYPSTKNVKLGHLHHSPATASSSSKGEAARAARTVADGIQSAALEGHVSGQGQDPLPPAPDAAKPQTHGVPGALNWVIFAPDTFDSNGLPVNRKKRRRTAKEEQSVLEATYSRNAHPSSVEVENMAKELNMTVKVSFTAFFCNLVSQHSNMAFVVHRRFEYGFKIGDRRAAGEYNSPPSRTMISPAQRQPTEEPAAMSVTSPSAGAVPTARDMAFMAQVAMSSAASLSRIIQNMPAPSKNLYPIERSASFGAASTTSTDGDSGESQSLEDDAAQALLGLSQSSEMSVSPERATAGSSPDDAQDDSSPPSSPTKRKGAAQKSDKGVKNPPKGTKVSQKGSKASNKSVENEDKDEKSVPVLAKSPAKETNPKKQQQGDSTTTPDVKPPPMLRSLGSMIIPDAPLAEPLDVGPRPSASNPNPRVIRYSEASDLALDLPAVLKRSGTATSETGGMPPLADEQPAEGRITPPSHFQLSQGTVGSSSQVSEYFNFSGYAEEVKDEAEDGKDGEEFG